MRILCVAWDLTKEKRLLLVRHEGNGLLRGARALCVARDLSAWRETFLRGGKTYRRKEFYDWSEVLGMVSLVVWRLSVWREKKRNLRVVGGDWNSHLRGVSALWVAWEKMRFTIGRGVMGMVICVAWVLSVWREKKRDLRLVGGWWEWSSAWRECSLCGVRRNEIYDWSGTRGDGNDFLRGFVTSA